MFTPEFLPLFAPCAGRGATSTSSPSFLPPCKSVTIPELFSLPWVAAAALPLIPPANDITPPQRPPCLPVYSPASPTAAIPHGLSRTTLQALQLPLRNHITTKANRQLQRRTLWIPHANSASKLPMQSLPVSEPSHILQHILLRQEHLPRRPATCSRS
jgi:hypothetical protein